MRKPLIEATNTKSSGTDKMNQKDVSDKEKVERYLHDMSNRTKDHSLRYDIQKCLEIIEGKENQEFLELKEEFIRIYEEKETLFSEKCDLVIENEYLKARIKENERRDIKNN